MSDFLAWLHQRAADGSNQLSLPPAYRFTSVPAVGGEVAAIPGGTVVRTPLAPESPLTGDSPIGHAATSPPPAVPVPAGADHGGGPVLGSAPVRQDRDPPAAAESRPPVPVAPPTAGEPPGPRTVVELGTASAVMPIPLASRPPVPGPLAPESARALPGTDVTGSASRRADGDPTSGPLPAPDRPVRPEAEAILPPRLARTSSPEQPSPPPQRAVDGHETPARMPATEPPIEVTIGRVEIRHQSPGPGSKPSRPALPPLAERLLGRVRRAP